MSASPQHAEKKMTPEQADELRTLAQQSGETFDPELTADAAAAKIADLRRADGGGEGGTQDIAGGSPGG